MIKKCIGCGSVLQTEDESLRGYAVYNLLSNVQELIKTGDFRSFPKFIAEFDNLEERAKQERE